MRLFESKAAKFAREEAERKARFEELYGDRVNPDDKNQEITRSTLLGRIAARFLGTDDDGEVTYVQSTDNSWKKVNRRGQDVHKKEERKEQKRQNRKKNMPARVKLSEGVSFEDLDDDDGGGFLPGLRRRKKNRQPKSVSQPPSSAPSESPRDRKKRLKREGHKPEDIDYFMGEGLTEEQAKEFNKSDERTIKRWKQKNNIP